MATYIPSIGDFSLGYATIDSPTLTSAETPFRIISASSLNGTTFTFPAPGQILAGGPVPATDVYTITVEVNSADPITGIFLNTIDDANNGFPTGGPGRYSNGNFELTEFTAFLSNELAPSITPHNPTVAVGQSIPLSSILSVIGTGITQYELWFSWGAGGAPANTYK